MSYTTNCEIVGCPDADQNWERLAKTIQCMKASHFGNSSLSHSGLVHSTPALRCSNNPHNLAYENLHTPLMRAARNYLQNVKMTVKHTGTPSDAPKEGYYQAELPSFRRRQCWFVKPVKPVAQGRIVLDIELRVDTDVTCAHGGYSPKAVRQKDHFLARSKRIKMGNTGQTQKNLRQVYIYVTAKARTSITIEATRRLRRGPCGIPSNAMALSHLYILAQPGRLKLYDVQNYFRTFLRVNNQHLPTSHCIFRNY